MASRLELHEKLVEVLGSRNVYYQSPESMKMQYPAIRYSKSRINNKFANDKTYQKLTRYEVTVIDYEPDSPVVDALLELPYCTFDRAYNSNNLHHEVLTIYY